MRQTLWWGVSGKCNRRRPPASPSLETNPSEGGLGKVQTLLTGQPAEGQVKVSSSPHKCAADHTPWLQPRAAHWWCDHRHPHTRSGRASARYTACPGIPTQTGNSRGGCVTHAAWSAVLPMLHSSYLLAVRRSHSQFCPPSHLVRPLLRPRAALPAARRVWGRWEGKESSLQCALLCSPGQDRTGLNGTCTGRVVPPTLSLRLHGLSLALL